MGKGPEHAEGIHSAPIASPAMRVIVVGAGVAGLTVADALRCAGAEVTVLEARDRIGGRTWTAPFGPGLIDLGAAWVHGPVGNPLAEALATAGISTRNDGPYHSRMAVWADGWADGPDATALTAAVEGDWDPSEALAALSGSDRFVDGVEWFLADRELDGRAGELARFGLLWVWGAMLFAAPPDRISLAGAAAYAWGAGGNLVPAGGYRTLVDRLSAGLDVRLGTAATVVHDRGSGVDVDSDGGTFEGDQAVVTVPLGVLKAGTLAFDPPLGAGHREAVKRLAMGTLEKVVLRFPERFWGGSVRQITHVATDHAFPDWADFSRHVGSPTLVGFYNPAVAPHLAELSVEQRVGPALDVLRKMFGSVPDPDEALVTRLDAGQVGTWLVQLRADRGRRRRHTLPRRTRLRPSAAGGRGYGAGVPGAAHAAFVSGLRAAGHALGMRPERLSLGVVPPHWLAQI